MFKKHLILFIFLIGLFLNVSSVLAGVVLSSYKYAWSNNSGYINFENVIVGDSSLSGYAWSANNGWIKFNPTSGGVFNDGNGNLSGDAWGEGLGWINFDGISISTSTGKFSGIATGTLVGTINFSCPNYCDVRTDWRPAPTICTSWTYSDWGSCSLGQQSRSILSSSPSGCTLGSPVLTQSCSVVKSSGRSGSRAAVTIPLIVSSYNQDLVILPEQTGTYTQDTPAGQIILQVPVDNIFSKTAFIISTELTNLINEGLDFDDLRLINGVIYNVIAKEENGNLVHFFPKPITITLPIKSNISNKNNLAVYWLNDVNREWVLIPDVVFYNDKVTFKVNHLTKFAILEILGESLEVSNTSLINEKIKPNIPIRGNNKSTTTNEKNIVLPQNIQKNNLLFLGILVVILFIIFGYKYYVNKKHN